MFYFFIVFRLKLLNISSVGLLWESKYKRLECFALLYRIWTAEMCSVDALVFFSLARYTMSWKGCRRHGSTPGRRNTDRFPLWVHHTLHKPNWPSSLFGTTFFMREDEGWPSISEMVQFSLKSSCSQVGEDYNPCDLLSAAAPYRWLRKFTNV